MQQFNRIRIFYLNFISSKKVSRNSCAGIHVQGFIRDRVLLETCRQFDTVTVNKEE